MIGEMTFKCVELSSDKMQVSQSDGDIYIFMSTGLGSTASVYLDKGQVIDLVNHLNNYIEWSD